MWIYIGICVFLSLALLVLFLSYQKLKSTLSETQKLYLSAKSELDLKEKYLLETKEMFANQKTELKNDYAQNLKQLEEKYQNNLISLKKEWQDHLESQNKTLLLENKTLLNQDSKKLLDEIFKPIQEQVKQYSDRLTHNEISLKTNIENMFKYSQTLEDNAQKLAKILKGDKKVRGNFGEMQLKSILENSGLIQGEQYKLQESFSHEGRSYIPDAVIYLQKDKTIIIDAKFSLPSELDFENLTQEVCDQIAKNLKSRIDELAKKPYTSFSPHTYDFVLLFIPYQNILDLALESEGGIYAYAYSKKVYLTTPHTLFMALKTIQITWIDIKRNDNANKAFEEIGKFYEKFVGVLESFEDIKASFTRLEKAKNEMENRLIAGNGNLASRFKKLEELGVKSKKSIQQS